MLLVFSLVAAVSAQEMPTYTCPDGSSVTPNITLSLPAQPPATPVEPVEPYLISVITGSTIPTVAITSEITETTCAMQDALAETVAVTYTAPADATPTTYGLSPYSAWIASQTEADQAQTM
ncbi:MAG: hypothetical protein HC794_03130, partial [Nitrospiraceae bacterium]|nr:hypothetical protein [Nitrospiraceae bacterium]